VARVGAPVPEMPRAAQTGAPGGRGDADADVAGAGARVGGGAPGALGPRVHVVAM
jgi:hypothetical protein